MSKTWFPSTNTFSKRRSSTRTLWLDGVLHLNVEGMGKERTKRVCLQSATSASRRSASSAGTSSMGKDRARKCKSMNGWNNMPTSLPALSASRWWRRWKGATTWPVTSALSSGAGSVELHTRPTIIRSWTHLAALAFSSSELTARSHAVSASGSLLECSSCGSSFCLSFWSLWSPSMFLTSWLRKLNARGAEETAENAGSSSSLLFLDSYYHGLSLSLSLYRAGWSKHARKGRSSSRNLRRE